VQLDWSRATRCMPVLLKGAGQLCRITAGERDPGVKAHFASLLRSSRCALTIADAGAADEPLVHVSAAFEAATGYSAAEVLGRDARLLQAPPGAARVPTIASTALKRCVCCLSCCDRML
jgi:PAS domain-containing protein